MKRWSRAGASRGYTLVEALTVITVLAILSIGVSLMYIQALQMYQRGSREATARDKSALALARMIPDVREAYNVDYPGPSLIVFSLPEKDADGNYHVDPVTKSAVLGRQISFYQSDANGNYDDSGGYIWRSERPNVSSAWSNVGVVMDDVEDLSFTYAPSVEMPELVRVAVTVGQGEHPGYYNRTECAEVLIRNH